MPSRTICHHRSHHDPPVPTHVLPLRRTAALATVAAVATAFGLAVSTPVQSQRPTTFPTGGAAAIRRIWQIVMDSSRVEALGQVMLDSIGPRLTGGSNMLAASDCPIAQ